MSNTIKERLQSEIKLAMKAKDAHRLGVLRLLAAAIKQIEVDTREEMGDAAILAICEKEVKQRKDAIATYEKSGHIDMAEAEKKEILILQEFLPEPASVEEIQTVVQKAVSDVAAQGVSGPAMMGKVMGLVKAELAGRADMAEVSKVIKAHLS